MVRKLVSFLEGTKLESTPEFETLVAEVSTERETQRTAYGACVEAFISIAPNALDKKAAPVAHRVSLLEDLRAWYKYRYIKFIDLEFIGLEIDC